MQLAVLYSLSLDDEAGEVLLQVLLDQIVGGRFGLTEPGDDERKSVSQRLSPLSAFLHAHGTLQLLDNNVTNASSGNNSKHDLEVAFHSI